MISIGGGGGGAYPQILVGMCRGKWQMGGGGHWSELERENVGLQSKLERVSGGLQNWVYLGCVWLALWLAANPGVLPELFAFGWLLY